MSTLRAETRLRSGRRMVFSVRSRLRWKMDSFLPTDLNRLKLAHPHGSNPSSTRTRAAISSSIVASLPNSPTIAQVTSSIAFGRLRDTSRSCSARRCSRSSCSSASSPCSASRYAHLALSLRSIACSSRGRNLCQRRAWISIMRSVPSQEARTGTATASSEARGFAGSSEDVDSRSRNRAHLAPTSIAHNRGCAFVPYWKWHQ